jgi:hypothetical protein
LLGGTRSAGCGVWTYRPIACKDGGGERQSVIQTKQRKRMRGGGLKGGPVWVWAIIGPVARAGSMNSAISY